MKEGWKKVRLADYYDISSGLSKSAKFFGSGYPFLAFKDVFKNYFVPYQLTQLVQSNEKERQKCSIKKGDVFLTRTSETVEDLGMSCVALKDYENATFNGFTKRLRPKPNSPIDPQFMGFYLRSPQFRAEVTAYSSLTTRASLNNSIIGRLHILLPPFKNQRQIATLLSTYDDLIENNLQRIKLLEEQAQQVYEEWFVRMRFPGWEECKVDGETGLPVGWKKKKIGDICQVTGGKRLPKGHSLLKVKTKHPYIRVKNLNKSGIDLASILFIKEETYKKIKRYIITENDIYLSNAGTIGLVGIIPKTLSGANLTENCVKLGNFKNEDLQEFINYFLKSDKGQYLIASRTGGASQPKLAIYRILNIPIVLPTKSLLNQFSKNMKENRNMKENLISQNRLLKEARDLLLPRLMMGLVNLEELVGGELK